ncbi:MAG: FTR1 family protein [Chloroflexi bacterium]|nr:FTR1 family protein [Chloroflexota bacterium]
MLASFLITGRETLEASLLVGMLLAYLAHTGNRGQFKAVWLGSLAAALLSVLIAAAVLLTIGSLKGTAEEVLEGSVMLAAAGVLTYVVVWLHRQGRELNRSLQSSLAAALRSGSSGPVALLSFLAVFREGAETALYLSAMAAASPGAGTWIGAGTGFGAAVGVGYLVYRGSRVLNLRTFFRLTTIVLVLFGAGLVGQATLVFQAAGLFPGTISVGDFSHILPDTSTLGSVLHTLVGYSATPSLLQVILWAGYITVILALFLDVGSKETRTLYGEPFRPLGASYHHRLYRLLRWPRLPTMAPLAMGVVLVGLLAVAALSLKVGPFDNQGPLRLGPFQNPENGNNLFNFVMWVLWLPLLSISAVLVGRLWCGNLCPLRLATDTARSLADRVAGRSTSASPYLRLGWLLPVTFILVTFFVKWWPVQSVARYGAILFLTILALATVVGFLFRPGTWCRYVCPIGGWLARITRLSPLGLRANPSLCAACSTKPCLTGTALAGRCPVYLNPSRLESNRNCLKCWKCVVNCPDEKASLRLGWRFPGAELLKPYAPDLWESLFVASLLGMYIATGHRSPTLAALPWPLVFFGLIALATAAYLGLSGIIALAGNIPFRQTLTTFGYVFLPLEFSTAIIAFGDDALEFFGITQPAASLLLGLGFLWSIILGVSIVRNQCRGKGRALAAAIPAGIALLAILFLWLSWYASGVVIDVT